MKYKLPVDTEEWMSENFSDLGKHLPALLRSLIEGLEESMLQLPLGEEDREKRLIREAYRLDGARQLAGLIKKRLNK